MGRRGIGVLEVLDDDEEEEGKEEEGREEEEEDAWTVITREMESENAALLGHGAVRRVEAVAGEGGEEEWGSLRCHAREMRESGVFGGREVGYREVVFAVGLVGWAGSEEWARGKKGWNERRLWASMPGTACPCSVPRRTMRAGAHVFSEQTMVPFASRPPLPSVIERAGTSCHRTSLRTFDISAARVDGICHTARGLEMRWVHFCLSRATRSRQAQLSPFAQVTKTELCRTVFVPDTTHAVARPRKSAAA